MRADALLVRRGLARSRTQARQLIDEGAVRWHDASGQPRALKPASELPDDAALSVAPSPAARFVSRGGLKLEGALERAAIDVAGVRCLDVGQSTGGFTDCLLAHGAARVTGVDVGHGQLDSTLRADPRVAGFEGFNVRDADPASLGAERPAGGFALIVVDVSFVSLALVLPALGAYAAARATLLALVKPQFEVGRGGLDKRGVVRDAAAYDAVRVRIERTASEAGWRPDDWFESPIAGGEGNREFFIVARRQPGAGGVDDRMLR